jgi:hypothetical protein
VAGPQPFHHTAQSAYDPLVSLSEERGEDVLAYLLAPEVISTVTPWVVRRIQVDPVFLRAAGETISPVTNPVPLERQAALETIDVYPTRCIKIDSRFHFFVAPVPSYKFAK